MVDIDSNVSQTTEKQDSNRNTPKSEHENDTTADDNNSTQELDNEADNEQNEERMTGGHNSPNGCPRPPLIALRDSPPIPEHFPSVDDDFVYPVQSKYICPNCKGVFRYPVQLTACGHRLCYPCFKELLSGPAPRCPLDQVEMNREPEMDKGFFNEVQKLEVKCRNKEWGCKWEGELVNFQTHVAEECEYSTMMCENDCGAEFQKRFKQKHTDKDCVKRIISCPYCDDRHLRGDKKEHLQECPKLPMPCPNKCDKKLELPRDELDRHIEIDCPKTKIMCQFEPLGCAHRCSREKMPKHSKVEIINHVKLLYDLLSQHKVMLNSTNDKLLEHETVMKSQERRIGDLEKIAHSQLIWRIEDYTRKLKEAKSGDTETLFSPTFTTSKHGYRLCASVCLNGDGKGKGTHMSVFISVLKGAFDALLKWPFDYRVKFTLLDQAEEIPQRKHITFSIKPNPCPENSPFLGRPKMEKNASFGCAKFAKHEELESRMYIKDDTVFLKISVDIDGLSEP